MKQIFMLTLSFLLLLACDTGSTVNPDNVPLNILQSGEWTLKNVFLGDAIDGPCSWEANGYKTMTFNFKNEKTNSNAEGTEFIANGQSSVNQFYTSYKVLSFDKSTNRGKIKMGGVGGTKIGGPTPLIECESRYYGLISSSQDFEIIQENNDTILHLGNLKSIGSQPSRDGGTYLIFKLQKKSDK
ncbi:MAG: hypothetical protein ACRCVT_14400 [Leadbetterella sp.]